MDDFVQRGLMMSDDMASDKHLRDLTMSWYEHCSKYEYSYHFSWLGLPIIQFPQDIVAIQEIIWNVNPDLVVETGIARGGSLILHASILELLEGSGEVLGIDIDIRNHNRVAIEQHTMHKRIKLIQGSSIDPAVVQQVEELAERKQRVLVLLDSNHTHDHVLTELRLYSPFVKQGSYMIVFDTIIEDMPDSFSASRPWGRGNNPKTAVTEFLSSNDRFTIDSEYQRKLLITAAPDGYLKCIKG